MYSDKLKPSNMWYNILYPNQEIIIMDPDGWDRSNYNYSFYVEPITKSEFEKRLMNSTCIMSKKKS